MRLYRAATVFRCLLLVSMSTAVGHELFVDYASAESTGPGITYFVDSEMGNDAHDGRARTKAFRTLARAVTALNRFGGDTLVLRGVFQETLQLNGINWSKESKPDMTRRTTIRCAVDSNGRRLTAVIDGGIPPVAKSFPFDCQGKQPGLGPGKDNRFLDRGIVIAQCNAVTIDGITVQGIAGLGVLTWRSCHIILRHLTVEWTSQSALMLTHGRFDDPMVSDLTVEFCRINQSNLGHWRDWKNTDPRKRGYEMRSETMSLVRWDGFRVHHNRISNSLMEGIDFKEGSCNGKIHHNLVEQCRSAGIYANEGRDTKIYRNVVRRIGYYDPQDGTGLLPGGEYLTSKLPGTHVGEPGATGILISNGDLNGPGRPSLEVGRVSGIEVYENVISWTRKAGISVWNEWRKERQDGWIINDIRLDNNTCYRTCLGPNPASAAILFDAAATDVRIRNNILVSSDKFGMHMWNRPDWPQPKSPPQHDISHNLLYANRKRHTLGAHPIQAAPLFVHAPSRINENGDFAIRAESPARNAGVDTGLPRNPGTEKDLGAYEYGLRPWRAGVVETAVSGDDGTSGR